MIVQGYFVCHRNLNNSGNKKGKKKKCRFHCNKGWIVDTGKAKGKGRVLKTIQFTSIRASGPGVWTRASGPGRLDRAIVRTTWEGVYGRRPNQSFEKPRKAKMVSSSATRKIMAVDGSLSQRNLLAKENNHSINSKIIVNIIILNIFQELNQDFT